jgi:Chromo (CHRromatin Organisation MOdifier) domain
MGYMPQAHQPARNSSLPMIQEQLEKIKEARKAAQEAIHKTQDNLVIGSSKFMPFKEGDKVWLEGTNLKLPYETPKLSPRQYGPFRVAAKILDIAYQLELLEGWKIHLTFHASLLTPYKEMEAHGPNFIEPPLEIVEGEQEWEVEKVLRDRLYQKSQQYLVQWKGYSLAHDSWVKHSDLHAPDLISKYVTSKCSRAKDSGTNSQRSA